MDITKRSYLFRISAVTQGITLRSKSLYEYNIAGKNPTTQNQGAQALHSLNMGSCV